MDKMKTLLKKERQTEIAAKDEMDKNKKERKVRQTANITKGWTKGKRHRPETKQKE